MARFGELRIDELGVAVLDRGDLVLILQEVGGVLQDFRNAALLPATQPLVGDLFVERGTTTVVLSCSAFSAGVPPCSLAISLTFSEFGPQAAGSLR